MGDPVSQDARSAAQDRAALLVELRDREWGAACVGGLTWSAYVRECEKATGLSWEEIRERFNRMDREARHAD